MAKRNKSGSGKPRTDHAPLDPGPDLPRWVAPLVFAVATLLLFPEVFFKGNSLFGHDTLGLSYYARNFYTEFVRTKHAFPLWDPTILGGLPFLEGMHGDIFYPPSLALFFLHAKSMWAWKMVLHIFLAGIFAYIWLRRGMKLRRGPALFGGLVYMMGADLVSLIGPGGDGKLFVSALAPLVFWLAERAASGRRISDFAGFALGITLIILTSHMQLAYMCIWGVTGYFFYRAYQVWRDEQNSREALRLVGMFTVAGLLGVAAAAIQFFPPLHYLKHDSVRVEARKDAQSVYTAATDYAMNLEEVVSLVVPEFVGISDGMKDGRPSRTYWGRNGIKLNSEYAGVIALLLLPIVFLRRRMRGAWFFAGLGIMSLLYAVGGTTPLFHLFLLIPGVKLFRAPSVIIFLYGLSISTLGAMALQRLIEWRAGDSADARAVTQYLWILLGVVGVFALMGVSGGFAQMWRTTIFDPAMFGREGALAENMGRMKAGFAILFVLTAAVVAWWSQLRKGRFSPRVAVAILALLAAVDLYRVDRPFVRNTAMTNEAVKTQYPFFTPDSVMSYLIGQANDPTHLFRVASYTNPENLEMPYGYSRNALAIHGIEQVAGLHGNEMGRYVKLVGEDGKFLFSNLQLMNLVNAEYIVFPHPIQEIPLLQPLVLNGWNGAALYHNASASPRAFLVGRVHVMDDSAAFETIHAGQVDLRTNAFVPKAVPGLSATGGDPTGTVEWVEHGVNRLKLRVTSNQPALLVISENYYPAWKATVAGKSTDIIQTDYTFRGVVVPAGTSDVEMFYSTDHLKFAAITSIVTMLLLLGIVVSGLVRRAPVLVVKDEHDRI
jgi:hypothetical protein